jgi:hypothetical protein
MPRATRAQRQRRVDECRELVERGFLRHQIHAWVHQKASQPGGEHWVLQERQIDTYIQLAHAEIAKEANIDRPFEFGRAVSRLNSQYARAKMDHNNSLALKIQRELNRLLSLGPQDAASGEIDPSARREAIALEMTKMNEQDKAGDGQP